MTYRIGGQVVDQGSGVADQPVFVVDTGDSDPTNWTVEAATTTAADGSWSLVVSSGDLERYHAVTQFEDGSTLKNAESKPFVTGQPVVRPVEIPIQFNIPAPQTIGQGIPDSGLVHRYDATELTLKDGESVSTWADSSGSEDATAVNAPTFRTSGINGNPSVKFVDSSNHYLNVDFSSSISQPLEYFAVVDLSNNSFSQDYIDGFSQNVRTRFSYYSDSFELKAGNAVQFGSSPPTTPTIATSIFDGGSSELRLNGSGQGTVDVGTNGLDGLHIGTRIGGTNTSINGYLGEILVYDPAVSGYSRSDVESYLSNKWGISLA
jgi:hypothetical protein